MGLAIVAFIAIFVLVGSAGLLIAWRTGMTSRLTVAISPERQGLSWLERLRPERAGESLRAAIQPLDRILPKSPLELSVARKRLTRAGYREDAHVRIFYGCKVLVPVVLAALVAVGGVTSFLNPFMAYVMAFGL